MTPHFHCRDQQQRRQHRQQNVIRNQSEQVAADKGANDRAASHDKQEPQFLRRTEKLSSRLYRVNPTRMVGRLTAKERLPASLTGDTEQRGNDSNDEARRDAGEELPPPRKQRRSRGSVVGEQQGRYLHAHGIHGAMARSEQLRMLCLWRDIGGLEHSFGAELSLNRRASHGV